MDDDQRTAVMDARADGAEGASADTGETAAVVDDTLSSRIPSTKQAAAVGAGAAVVTGLLLAAIGRAGGKLELAPGESVLLSTRPRKVVWRYLATLGLWELARRSTRFTVTDQRVVVEEGVLARSTRSVPLSRIANVRVRTGVWQGFVDLSGSTKSGQQHELLGPLRNPVARAVARSVSHNIAPPH